MKNQINGLSRGVVGLLGLLLLSPAASAFWSNMTPLNTSGMGWSPWRTATPWNSWSSWNTPWNATNPMMGYGGGAWPMSGWNGMGQGMYPYGSPYNAWAWNGSTRRNRGDEYARTLFLMDTLQQPTFLPTLDPAWGAGSTNSLPNYQQAAPYSPNLAYPYYPLPLSPQPLPFAPASQPDQSDQSALMPSNGFPPSALTNPSPDRSRSEWVFPDGSRAPFIR